MIRFCDAVFAINWGSLPDWAAAIGTVGAVYLALRGAQASVRERKANELLEKRAAGRAIIANLADVINDLVGLWQAAMTKRGRISVVGEDGERRLVEFASIGLGASSLEPLRVEQSQLDVLESDIDLATRYRLVLKRHRATIATVLEYNVLVDAMRAKREQIVAALGRTGVEDIGEQTNLRVRVSNVAGIDAGLRAALVEDVEAAMLLADNLRDHLRPHFSPDSFPHLDTAALRADPGFPRAENP